MSEVQLPYGPPRWAKREWYSGRLSETMQLSAGDFVRCSSMDVKFEIDQVYPPAFHFFSPGEFRAEITFYAKSQKRESADFAIEHVCTVIEICGYSVWRKGRKVWPLEGS